MGQPKSIVLLVLFMSATTIMTTNGNSPEVNKLREELLEKLDKIESDSMSSSDNNDHSSMISREHRQQQIENLSHIRNAILSTASTMESLQMLKANLDAVEHSLSDAKSGSGGGGRTRKKKKLRKKVDNGRKQSVKNRPPAVHAKRADRKKSNYIYKNGSDADSKNYLTDESAGTRSDSNTAKYYKSPTTGGKMQHGHQHSTKHRSPSVATSDSDSVAYSSPSRSIHGSEHGIKQQKSPYISPTRSAHGLAHGIKPISPSATTHNSKSGANSPTQSTHSREHGIKQQKSPYSSPTRSAHELAHGIKQSSQSAAKTNAINQKTSSPTRSNNGSKKEIKQFNPSAATTNSNTVAYSNPTNGIKLNSPIAATTNAITQKTSSPIRSTNGSRQEIKQFNPSAATINSNTVAYSNPTNGIKQNSPIAATTNAITQKTSSPIRSTNGSKQEIKQFNPSAATINSNTVAYSNPTKSAHGLAHGIKQSSPSILTANAIIQKNSSPTRSIHEFVNGIKQKSPYSTPTRNAHGLAHGIKQISPSTLTANAITLKQNSLSEATANPSTIQYSSPTLGARGLTQEIKQINPSVATANSNTLAYRSQTRSTQHGIKQNSPIVAIPNSSIYSSPTRIRKDNPSSSRSNSVGHTSEPSSSSHDDRTSSRSSSIAYSSPTRSNHGDHTSSRSSSVSYRSPTSSNESLTREIKQNGSSSETDNSSDYRRPTRRSKGHHPSSSGSRSSSPGYSSQTKSSSSSSLPSISTLSSSSSSKLPISISSAAIRRLHKFATRDPELWLSDEHDEASLWNCPSLRGVQRRRRCEKWKAIHQAIKSYIKFKGIIKDAALLNYTVLINVAVRPRFWPAPAQQLDSTRRSVDESLPPNLNDGVPNLHEGVPNLREGAPNLHGGVPNLHDGVPNLLDGVPNLHELVPNLHDGVPNLSNGVPNLREGAPNLHGGVPNLNDGVPNLHGKVPNWEGLPLYEEHGGMALTFVMLRVSDVHKWRGSFVEPPIRFVNQGLADKVRGWAEFYSNFVANPTPLIRTYRHMNEEFNADNVPKVKQLMEVARKILEWICKNELFLEGLADEEDILEPPRPILMRHDMNVQVQQREQRMRSHQRSIGSRAGIQSVQSGRTQKGDKSSDQDEMSIESDRNQKGYQSSDHDVSIESVQSDQTQKGDKSSDNDDVSVESDQSDQTQKEDRSSDHEVSIENVQSDRNRKGDKSSDQDEFHDSVPDFDQTFSDSSNEKSTDYKLTKQTNSKEDDDHTSKLTDRSIAASLMKRRELLDEMAPKPPIKTGNVSLPAFISEKNGGPNVDKSAMPSAKIGQILRQKIANDATNGEKSKFHTDKKGVGEDKKEAHSAHGVNADANLPLLAQKWQQIERNLREQLAQRGLERYTNRHEIADPYDAGQLIVHEHDAKRIILVPYKDEIVRTVYKIVVDGDGIQTSLEGHNNNKAAKELGKNLRKAWKTAKKCHNYAMGGTKDRGKECNIDAVIAEDRAEIFEQWASIGRAMQRGIPPIYMKSDGEPLAEHKLLLLLEKAFNALVNGEPKLPQLPTMAKRTELLASNYGTKIAQLKTTTDQQKRLGEQRNLSKSKAIADKLGGKVPVDYRSLVGYGARHKSPSDDENEEKAANLARETKREAKELQRKKWEIAEKALKETEQRTKDAEKREEKERKRREKEWKKEWERKEAEQMRTQRERHIALADRSRERAQREKLEREKKREKEMKLRQEAWRNSAKNQKHLTTKTGEGPGAKPVNHNFSSTH